MQAFYNSGLISLNLESAREIGDFAFAVQGAREGMEAAYTFVSIPNAETIGNFAFFNGKEVEVTISASVKSIGYGAFASSSKLTAIKVENNHAVIDTDKCKNCGLCAKACPRHIIHMIPRKPVAPKAAPAPAPAPAAEAPKAEEAKAE